MGEKFDLAIIGGGTVGSMVFLDAVSRGLKTVLLERHNIGMATNRASLGLSQAGANYVAKDIDLVRMNAADCLLMENLAGDFLKRQRFLIPIFSDSKHSLRTFDLVFSVYDSLRSLNGRRAEKHQKLSRDEILNQEIFLRGDVSGGISFSEWVVDPVLLAEAITNCAQSLGGKVMENTEVTDSSLKYRGGGAFVDKVFVKNGGDKMEISASYFVNAAGPWAPQVLEKVFDLPRFPTRMTRGTSITINKRVAEAAVILFDRTGKYIAVLPQGDKKTLIGPTNYDIDASITASPDSLKPEDYEVKELLSVASRHFNCGISERDIVEVRCGLRPQLNHRGVAPNNITHEFVIIDHAKRDDVDNLLTVFGGKLSNQIRMAKETSDRVCQKLGGPRMWMIPCMKISSGGVKIHQNSSLAWTSFDQKERALSYKSFVNQMAFLKKLKSFCYLALFIIKRLNFLKSSKGATP